MPKKQLIVANDVREAAKSGERVIYISEKNAIVTAEARTVAKDLGVALQVSDSVPQKEAAINTSGAADEASIRQAIAAHAGGQVSEELLGEVMRRVEIERTARRQKGSLIQKIGTVVAAPATGGGATGMSQLDLASLMGGATVSPRAAGFLAWSNSSFPFARDSDEVNVILEGELEFRVNGEVVTARAGDVVLVRKGAQGEVGTPSSVRAFYLSYNG